MAYDFNCPYCGYGHNSEDSESIDENIGEHDFKCEMCKKEFIVEVYRVFEYWGRKK